MRSELIALFACAGCNAVFAIDETALVDAPPVESKDTIVIPDRDRDGIPDVDDPCIASIADAKTDYDGDSYPNDTDGCAFDYESVDTDLDTIFDECDPLRTVTGDRRRCIMAFQNANLNQDVWTPATGDTAMWDVLNRGIVGVGTGRIVAVERFEAPVATGYDLTIFVRAQVTTASPSAMTLWLRTNDVASAADVGCEVRGNTSTSTLTLLGAPVTTSTTVARSILSATHIHAMLEPAVSGRNNVRCTVVFGAVTTAASVAAEIALPVGTVGFGVANVNGHFLGLTVLERDDTPPL